ncbi:MAG: murein biosynthesis integral membrane protein MurJ [Longimicrobiales bacterium]
MSGLPPDPVSPAGPGSNPPAGVAPSFPVPTTPNNLTDVPTRSERPASGRSAKLVASGIMLSRIAGLVRERIFAQYFGVSIYSDAFRVALRMPGALQNLLGEGTLSASLIPVYAELLEHGRKEEAGRVAGAVFALLLAVAGGLSLVGVVLTPVFVTIFTPGFSGLQRELTIAAGRIIFPMTGLLVLSAWALGILNSHRKFFISYVSPVVWNAAMIATLLFFGGRMDSTDLVVALAWGALIGGFLQFAIQLPWVLSLERDLKVRWEPKLPGVRTAVRNAGPAIAGRGVVQLSGYVDIFLASVLAVGSVAALGFAQTLYILPISLFGMSIAAAELPELSRQRSAEAEALRERVNPALRHMAVLVVPSCVAFLLLGDIIVAALYQTGDFGADDTMFVYILLAGYSVGLLAATSTRLFASTFFALHDTKTPAKIAAVRVFASAIVGAALMLWLRGYSYAGHTLGPFGLSIAASGSAWLEWVLLRGSLRRRLGAVGSGTGLVLKLVASAIVAALVGRAVLLVLPESLLPESEQLQHIAAAAYVIIPFGLVYFLLARALGVREAAATVDRVFRRFKR